MSWAGKANISIDGNFVKQIDNYIEHDIASLTPTKNQLLYKSDYFTYGEHKVRLTNIPNGNKMSFGVNGAYIFSDNGAGKPIVNKTSIEVEKGDNATIRVNRFGGSKGNLIVFVETKDGTANNGTHYTGVSKKLEFGDGVSFIDIDIKTIEYKLANKQNVTFSLNIVNSSGLAGVGEPNSTEIKILDLPDPPGLYSFLPPN